MVANEDNETASHYLNVSENAFVYASQGETKRVCQEILPLLVWCMARVGVSAWLLEICVGLRFLCRACMVGVRYVDG